MQVTPLFQEPLNIPEVWMPASKAAVLMLIAIIQLINTRSLVQSYLNSGLKQWHSLKHGSHSNTQGVTIGETIAIKLRIINTLVVKVSKHPKSEHTLLVIARQCLHPLFASYACHECVNAYDIACDALLAGLTWQLLMQVSANE